MKRLFALSLALAFPLVACQPATSGTGSSSASADTGPIKIGFIGALTGDVATLGADTLNGVKMAVDQVNATGGINGRKVELIVEDGQCQSPEAASAAQKLVNVDHVAAILGGSCSSETLAAAPIAEAGKVVLMSYWSSSPKVTDAGDFVFRDYPNDANKAKTLASYLVAKGYTKLAIIGEDTDFAQNFREAVLKELPASVKVVFDETVNQGTKDYRTLMTRLKKTNFDIFLPNGQSDATVAEMAKQMRALGMKQQMIGGDAADSQNLGVIAKDAVEGFEVLSVPMLQGDTDKGKTFMTQFHDAYGEPQFGYYFASLSYDAANIIFSVIEKDGTDGSAIRDGLYAMQPYPGVSGDISFDKNGDVIGIPFAIKVFHDGKLEQKELVPVK